MSSRSAKPWQSEMTCVRVCRRVSKWNTGSAKHKLPASFREQSGLDVDRCLLEKTGNLLASTSVGARRLQKCASLDQRARRARYLCLLIALEMKSTRFCSSVGRALR